MLLDEVSEMGLPIQAKLLRVLQDKEVRPVGGAISRRVDVRVIAATNVALRDAVAGGRFREDLYHRLAVVTLELPPLRQRVGDVPLLVKHFLASSAAQEGKRIAGIEGEALRMLDDYRWPGNVRELQNEIQRLVVCGREGDLIRSGAISPWIRGGARGSSADVRPLREALREVETEILERLRQHRCRRAATARSLGITREALWAKLRHLGLAEILPRGSRAPFDAKVVSQPAQPAVAGVCANGDRGASATSR